MKPKSTKMSTGISNWHIYSARNSQKLWAEEWVGNASHSGNDDLVGISAAYLVEKRPCGL